MPAEHPPGQDRGLPQARHHGGDTEAEGGTAWPAAHPTPPPAPMLDHRARMESSRKEKVRLAARAILGGWGGPRGAQWVWERVQILAGVPAFPGVSGQVLPASPKAPAEVAQRMAGGEESRSWAAWGQPNMPQRGPHL